MKYTQAQFEIFKLHAMRAHAEIVSGAYKHREIFHYSGTPFTDSEKLKLKVEEMKRHIHLMQETADKHFDF